MPLPHEILHIRPNATAGEIEAAHRRLKMYANPSDTLFRETLDAARDAMLRRLVETGGQSGACGRASRGMGAAPEARREAPTPPVPQLPRSSYSTPRNDSRLQTVMIACIFAIVAFTSAYVVMHLNPRRTEETPSLSKGRQPDAAPAAEGRIAVVSRKILPSTVSVRTVNLNGSSSFGSGFFVNDLGDVMTNHHVVEDAVEIFILTDDEARYSAGVRAFDETRDMALLSTNAPAEKSIPLKIVPTRPGVGSEVVAAGSPKQLNQSVSNGIVAAIRSLETATYLQITAAISPGSSGGPVVDMSGAVVGMSTLTFPDGQNLNFALSAEHFEPFIAYARTMPNIDLRARAARRPRGAKPARPADEDNDPYDSLVFVSQDDQYTIYLFDQLTTYTKNRRIALILTKWIPTRAQRESTARGLGLTQKPLGHFLLTYAVDVENGEGAHISTINFYADGSVARDYQVPKLKWESIHNDRRIASFYAILTGRNPEEEAENLRPGDELVEYEVKRSGTITGDNVNCRALPSTTAEILGTLRQHTPVLVTQRLARPDGSAWYLIEHAGGAGWVSGRYLRLY